LTIVAVQTSRGVTIVTEKAADSLPAELEPDNTGVRKRLVFNF